MINCKLNDNIEYVNCILIFVSLNSLLTLFLSDEYSVRSSQPLLTFGRSDVTGEDASRPTLWEPAASSSSQFETTSASDSSEGRLPIKSELHGVI